MNKKFSDLFTFQPKSKIKAGEGQTIGKYPFFTCSPIQDKYYDSANYSGEALVFGTGGNATMHYVNGKFSTSTDCLVAYPKEETLPAYVYYYLFSDMEILQNGFRGSGLKHISKSYINDIEVPIIPKESQEKIITAMNTSLMIIKKRHEQIAVLDKLVKDVFVGMFGDPITNPKAWKVEMISNIASVRIGPFGTLLHAEEYIEGGIALINPQHMVNGIVEPNPKYAISNAKYQEMASYHLAKNDIVLGRRGEIGRCAIVRQNHLPAICGTGSMIIRPDTMRVTPEYLHAVFYQPSFSKDLEDKATGSTMKNINATIVNALKLPLPPIDLQIKYNDVTNKIGMQKLRLQTSLAELETTYKSTLQKAFNGELFQ